MRQAVLLVGGRGTRMWPLTDALPKGLLPLAGRPFVDLQMGMLKEVGVEEVILAADRFHEDAWRDYAAGQTDVETVVSIEPERMDTAGPLLMIEEMLDDQFLVLNGDVVLEGAVAQLVDAVPDEGDAAMATIAVADPSAYGVVVTDDAGRVERFVEKPPPGEEPGNAVNAGLYVLKRTALDGYVVGPLSFERQLFPDLVKRGALFGVEVSGSWIDIGTPELFLRAHAHVAAGKSTLLPAWADDAGEWNWIDEAAVVAPDASLARSVVLGPASIKSGARIEDAVVGWGATVGENALISEMALVGAGATVGSRCELAGGVRIAPRATLEDGSVTFFPPN